jgi:Na+-driven multidrug efflux pump
MAAANSEVQRVVFLMIAPRFSIGRGLTVLPGAAVGNRKGRNVIGR